MSLTFSFNSHVSTSAEADASGAESPLGEPLSGMRNKSPPQVSDEPPKNQGDGQQSPPLAARIGADLPRRHRRFPVMGGAAEKSRSGGDDSDEVSLEFALDARHSRCTGITSLLNMSAHSQSCLVDFATVPTCDWRGLDQQQEQEQEERHQRAVDALRLSIDASSTSADRDANNLSSSGAGFAAAPCGLPHLREYAPSASSGSPRIAPELERGIAFSNQACSKK